MADDWVSSESSSDAELPGTDHPEAASEDCGTELLPPVRAWLQAVASTGVASEFTLQDAEEQLQLATDYSHRLERWNAVVAVLEEEAERTNGQIGISLDAVVNGFGVRFTRETTDRIFSGIFNGLSNFVSCIVEACSRSQVGAHRAISRCEHTYQAEVARFEQDAALMLRDVFDTQPDLTNEAVCHRAKIAVSQLYQKHAVKAIEREKAAMEVCCTHLTRFKQLCAGYVPLLFEGGSRQPGSSNAASHYFEHQVIQMFHTVRAAYGIIHSDPVLRSRFSAFMVHELIDSFDNKNRVRFDNWMRCYGLRIQDEIGLSVAQRTALINLPHTHTVWHMVAVNTLIGDASSTPLQAPGSHAPFPGRVSVVSATLSPEDRPLLMTIGAIPVVRACHVLSTLVNGGGLRMGLLSCKWVQTAAMADAARYEQSKSLIFQGTINPLSAQSAIPFNPAWIAPSEMRDAFREVAKRTIRPENKRPGSPLVRTPNSEINMGVRLSFGNNEPPSSIAQPLEWATMQQAATVLSTLEPHTVVDYAVLWIIGCCIVGMPRTFESWQIPLAAIISRVQTLVPSTMRPATEQALNPRVAGVLKLFGIACAAKNIRVGYMVDGNRRRVLVFSRSVPSDITPLRVVALVQEILSHLKDKRPLSAGVTWHIKSSRNERRLRSKASTKLREQYVPSDWHTANTGSTV
jgi:hypothetical protein